MSQDLTITKLFDQWFVILFVLWALHILWKQFFKPQGCQKICQKPTNEPSIVTLRRRQK